MQADITSLYPMVAALCEGQRAGVEFISLRELVMLGNRDAEYSDETLEDLQTTSVYEGVDRAIYQKGGVALTSDALRTQALQNQHNRAEVSWLSTKTMVLWAITGVSLLGFIGSATAWGVQSIRLAAAKTKLETLTHEYNLANTPTEVLVKSEEVNETYFGGALQIESHEVYDVEPVDDVWAATKKTAMDDQQKVVDGFAASTATARWMAVGFAAVTLIMSGISTYMSWQDLKDHYKGDFSPIPRFMVDETSITYYNERGDQLVKENHAAYYEAVTCNRKTSDSNYKALDDCADLNGDVGQQWLALYACKDYKEMQPMGSPR